ncbi:hypothetical protein OC846_005490 [Tilletia horrida]|uniref:Uncharacterized protein n=1 Tax=Tilletia horrida TaxID=155126 RepID=A0AAN6GKR2_9BASI|nr:hypothetical protein OC846_005490 [Tilletia horrida]KAK0549493.1 hypothetical protein OC845_003112 [Tilletia horrida]KAK0561757.1 hypothetical protein OC861_005663 [Tilletia horrida]
MSSSTTRLTKKGRASSVKPTTLEAEPTNGHEVKREASHPHSRAQDTPAVVPSVLGPAPPASSQRQESNVTLSSTPPAESLTLPPELERQPLPVLAWCRIIDRAQRGIGDASYNSDDDDVALQEAADERPRGEVTRIVRSLHTLKDYKVQRVSHANTHPRASDEALHHAKARLAQLSA